MEKFLSFSWLIFIFFLFQNYSLTVLWWRKRTETAERHQYVCLPFKNIQLRLVTLHVTMQEKLYLKFSTTGDNCSSVSFKIKWKKPKIWDKFDIVLTALSLFMNPKCLPIWDGYELEKRDNPSNFYSYFETNYWKLIKCPKYFCWLSIQNLFTDKFTRSSMLIKYVQTLKKTWNLMKSLYKRNSIVIFRNRMFSIYLLSKFL